MPAGHHELDEENIRRFGLRLRVAFQVFIALAATVIGIGVAIMIRDAVQSRSVIVEPFDAPASLAVKASPDAPVHHIELASPL